MLSLRLNIVVINTKIEKLNDKRKRFPFATSIALFCRLYKLNFHRSVIIFFCLRSTLIAESLYHQKLLTFKL